jgi:hypothetical protein
MSDYLRDVLGAGSRILNPSQPLALVAADIPSADGEGANEGFWRVQLRDRLGNWAEMGGIFTFEIELEGLGKITGHAKLEEVVGPGVGRFRVEDHPVLGTRDIELTEDSFEAADALIPDADYERITGKDVTPDTPAAAPALKDSITGDEALQKIYGQMGLHAKESGRFAVGRSVTDVRAAAKETYKTVYEKLKVEYPELMTEFPDYESYWSYASNTLAAGVFTRWADSVDDILPLSKASNKIYAREILGLKEDGMIEFYRNSVNHKSSQELAGAGYASLDRRMAWDYNSYLIKYEDSGLNENDGRYTVRARPDEVTGLLGISGAEDEYGVVIGLDVVSQPGRVTRVGDLEMQQVAPWSNDIQTFDRSGGGSPFRRVSPASQFEVFATEHPMPGSTYADFYEAFGLDKDSRPIPTKWDEMFGEGSFDALNGDYPYYQSIKNLFIDAGDGKVGLDMMELDQISSRDSQNPQANDTYDKTLKMLSVIQELSGKTFMVHRGHNQDDPRIPDESVEAPEPVEVSTPDIVDEVSPIVSLKSDTDMVGSNGTIIKPGDSVEFTTTSFFENNANSGKKITLKYTGSRETDITPELLDERFVVPGMGPLYSDNYIFELTDSPDPDSLPNGFYIINPSNFSEDKGNLFQLENNNFIGESLPKPRSYGEQSALNDYGGFGYASINRYLRTGSEEDKEKASLATIQLLDSYLENSTLDKDMTLYRGIQIDDEEYLRALLALKEGDTFTDLAYFSTTTRSDLANTYSDVNQPGAGGVFAKEGSTGVLFKIEAKKGTKAGVVFRSSASGQQAIATEREVILPRGEKMSDKLIVTSVSKDPDGRIVVNLDYVPSSEELVEVSAPDVVEEVSDTDQYEKDLSNIVTTENFGPGDKTRIFDYTDAGYKGINNYLRNPRVYEYQEYQEEAEKLNEIIKSNTLNEETTLYRIVANYDEVTYEPGDIIDDKGIQSTSKIGFDVVDDTVINKLYPGGEEATKRLGYTRFKIIAPAGTEALDITELSMFRDEGEVLLPAGTKLRVVSSEVTPIQPDYLPVPTGEYRDVTLEIVNWSDIQPDSAKVEGDFTPITDLDLDMPAAEKSIDFSDFRKVSGPLGSNPGGVYQDPETGEKYYVKIQDTRRGENEELASALYREAGLDALEVKSGTINGQPVTYTDWRDDEFESVSRRIFGTTPEQDDKGFEGFAMDAWLANWDVVGTGYDNLSFDKDGNPVRLDSGGSLLYRARGDRKGSAFGNEVSELDTFKSPANTTGQFFQHMGKDAELNSVKKLEDITPEKIDELVDKYISDPTDNAELKEKLKARRENILDRYAEQKLKDALEDLPNVPTAEEELEDIPDGEPEGVNYEFNGEKFYFSPEELEKANFYVSNNYVGSKEVSDEEGIEFNKRMRALTEYLRPGSTSDETIEAQEKLMGTKINVGELRHSAPPSRFAEIEENGIQPKITDKVGTEKYSRRRFGVFLANDYTSGEAGKDADVFRVKVPKDDLRVDSGYTPYGDNLYIERTIEPSEIEHLGHKPAVNIDPELLNEYDLHNGRSDKCTACHPELKAVSFDEPESSKLSIWDRQKLRDIKLSIGSILDDPEVIEILETVDIADLEKTLQDRGIYRKARAAQKNAAAVGEAEKKYSEIDPNLDANSGTKPAAPYASVPGLGSGVVGYLYPRDVIESVDKDSQKYNKDLIEAQETEIAENGFTSPVVLIYDEASGKYNFKDPEMDYARLLAARKLKRYAPVTIEKDGESYHPFFSSTYGLDTPEEFIPEDASAELYPDVSGISDLPIPDRTEDEKDAINTYQRWSYLDLKNHMENPYGDPDKTDEERKKLDKVVDDLDNLTSTEPLPAGLELYRGIELLGSRESEDWYEYFSELQPGDVLVNPSFFTSTSLDQVMAEKYATLAAGMDKDPEKMRSVVMKITTKDGATGAAFENDGGVYALEKEVLLPTLANLTVTRVFKDADGVLRVELDYGPKDRTPEAVEVSVPDVVEEVEEQDKDAKTLLDEVVTQENIFLVNTLINLVEIRNVTKAPLERLEEDELLPKESRTIKRYITDTYKAINGLLRGEPHSSDEYTEEQIQNFISIINGIFDKHPKTVSPSVVFRGFNFGSGQTKDAENFKNLQVGDIIEDAAFISTSEDPVVSWEFGPGAEAGNSYKSNITTSGGLGGVFMVVNVPVGSKVMPITVPGIYGEKEVLLPAGSKFKIKDIKAVPAVDPIGQPTEYINHFMEVDLVPDGDSDATNAAEKRLTSADGSSEKFWDTDKLPGELKAEVATETAKSMLDSGISIEQLDALNKSRVSMYDTGTNDPYVSEWGGSVPFGQIMVVNGTIGFVPLAAALSRSSVTADELKSMSSTGDFNLTMRDVKKILEKANSSEDALSEFKLYSELTDFERATMATSSLISDWASSSNGNNPRSLAIQEIAEIVFDTKNARDWKSPPQTREKIEKIKQEYGGVLSAFLQAQYEQTQKRFKEAGITEVVLYRGIDDGALGRTLSDNELTKVDVQSRPLSSWSTSDGHAYWFATGGYDPEATGTDAFDPEDDHKGAVLLRRVVPVEQILSSSFTGVGSYDEREMVVIGGEMKAEAVGAVKENNLIQVMRGLEKSEQSPVIEPEATTEKKERIEPGFKNWYKKIKDIFTESDEDYDESRGNVLQSVFLEKSGFNEKPQVLSQEEFDAAAGESIYRGYTSTEFMDDYINSDTPFAGEGYFGNGTYSTNKKETTFTYTGSDDSNREDRIMEMKLMSDANVVSFDDVTDLREWATEKLREFFRGYDKSGATFEEYQDAEWRLFNETDYTNVAIMLGIDAIKFKVPLTPDNEYYTIILNRGKVFINGKS